jgi:hypothetical protein
LSVVDGRIGDMVGKPSPVCLEEGPKKVFASALDWPGWSRAGRNEEAALEALESYRPRYEVVARRAGVAFPSTAFTVVDRCDSVRSAVLRCGGRIIAGAAAR